MHVVVANSQGCVPVRVQMELRNRHTTRCWRCSCRCFEWVAMASGKVEAFVLASNYLRSRTALGGRVDCKIAVEVRVNGDHKAGCVRNPLQHHTQATGSAQASLSCSRPAEHTVVHMALGLHVGFGGARRLQEAPSRSPGCNRSCRPQATQVTCRVQETFSFPLQPFRWPWKHCSHFRCG